MLNLNLIRIDGGTQPRASINESVVSEYADALTDGAKLPAVVVFHDGADYWLADGFHRYHANRRIGSLDIDAEIKQGTKRDAVLYSVGANHAHGLRRSNEDKRNAVLTLLRDDEWMAWSDNKIAKACAVDHKTVAAVRASILGNSQDAAPALRTVERGGKVYQQNTSNIGKKPAHPTNEEGAAQPATTTAPEAVMGPASDTRSAPVVKKTTAAPPSDQPPGHESHEDAERELLADHERLLADNQMMGRVFESDDRLAAAMREIARLTEENRVLLTRVNGLINEKDAAVKAAKACKRKLDALEKRTGAA